MRVLLLSDVFHPVRNGVVHHIELLQRELTRRGHEVRIMAAGAPHPLDGEFVQRYPTVPLGRTGYGIGWPKAQALRALASQADILHVHHPFLSGLIGLRAARRYGIPLILTSHTRYDLYLDAYAPWVPPALSHRLMRMWMHRLCARSAAVVAPGAGAAAILAGWGVRAPVHVIENGIDVGRFRSTAPLDRSVWGWTDHAVLALYVGRLSVEKNVRGLLRAFAQAAHAEMRLHLLLAGEGAQRDQLVADAAAAGISHRVTFLGAFPYADMPALMASADLFVSASSSESFPLTFLEAAAAGLPSLGVRSPGIAEIIFDGVTGLLARDDGADFAARLVALAVNEHRRRQMGMAAATAASMRWPAEHMAAAIESLYAEAIAEFLKPTPEIVTRSTDAARRRRI